MRTKNEVSTVLQDPTPCDGCTHRPDCRSEKLACLDFQAWVNNGTIRQPRFRDPTHKIYRLVFRGERAA